MVTNNLAQVMNTVITVTTWTLILPYSLSEQDAWSTPRKAYDLLYSMASHSLPLLTSTTNYILLSNTIGYYSDVWMTIIMAFSYLTFSYIWTKNTGYTIYSFLTWKTGDEMTAIFATLVPVMSIFVQFGWDFLSQILRNRIE